MIQLIGNIKDRKHYFFGFHDLLITNNAEDKVLMLGVDNISKPPSANDLVDVGYYCLKTNQFIKLSETKAWNYPQGSRQQWIGETDLMIYNDRLNDNWGSFIIDTQSGDVVNTNPFPVHCLNSENGDAFYFNYSRVHRVGGYGYIGLKDLSHEKDIPENCGIYKANINTGDSEVLVSILEVASAGEKRPITTGYPHYVTHLCLNPSKTRLAFLHRYRLADGGETTRLMTIGVNGEELRCLSKGFLSHFTWLDDKTVFIWGQKSASVSNLRESRFYNNKLISFGIKLAKAALKSILSKSSNVISKKTFLTIEDIKTAEPQSIGDHVLLEDGHPMLNPKYKDWLVNDTYPNSNGVRTLMLYNVKTNQRIDLGTFRMLDTKPDLNSFSIQAVQEGIDQRIKAKFPLELYCFTRSGLHCDLHPRWSYDGKTVYFDSIHEGKRQVYGIHVEKYF